MNGKYAYFGSGVELSFTSDPSEAGIFALEQRNDECRLATVSIKDQNPQDPIAQKLASDVGGQAPLQFGSTADAVACSATSGILTCDIAQDNIFDVCLEENGLKEVNLGPSAEAPSCVPLTLYAVEVPQSPAKPTAT